MSHKTSQIGRFAHKDNRYEVLVDENDKFEIRRIKNVLPGSYTIKDIALELKEGDRVFLEIEVSKETNNPHLLPGFKNPFQMGDSDPNLYAPSDVRVIVE